MIQSESYLKVADNTGAQIVGHIEEGKRSLTIKSEFGTFEY